MITLRTFIAIELSDATRHAVNTLQQRLKGITPPHAVRWTAAQNIHLTLHFLGDVPAEEIEQISNAMQQATVGVAPFTLPVGGLGCFPNMRRPRVIWVGLTERSGPLLTLHQKLGHQLAAAIDFAPETRPYSAHLTLGRVKSGIPRRHLKQLSDVLQQEQQRVGKLANLHVAEINLIKSELKPTGSVYTQLHSSVLSTMD